MNNKETIMRYQIADYLNTGTDETPVWAFMGTGFNTLDENPAAQSDGKTYISDKAQSSKVKSYQVQFPFDTDLIASEEAIMALYEIGRNQKIGADAQLDYVRVELFQNVSDTENTFKARRFKVSAEVASIAGSGGEAIKVTGNLNNVGSFTDGTFNTTTKTFTPAA